MKVFFKNTKFNFVDENNVFVGYDMGQSCCEHADYFITENSVDPYNHEKSSNAEKFDLESYVFSTSYFKEQDSPHLEAGRQVTFLLVSESKPLLFLNLFNCHNGYYSHGFEAKIGDDSWQGGLL